MLRVLKLDGKIIIGDLMFESQKDKGEIMKTLTKDEIEEIEDEYYSNIDFLREQFEIHRKKLEVTRIDKLVFVVEVN